MKSWLAVIGFTFLTALCWGVYGPVLQKGQFGLGEPIGPMVALRWRAFICVGLAYFLIAIVVPVIWLKLQGEKGSWTKTGFFWSFIAGVAGALGALGIILAFSFKGKPIFVMPLVFGLAPVVNTFLTAYWSKAMKEIGPIFIAGLIIVAVGAVTVLLAKPQHTQHTSVHIAETNSGAIEVTYDLKDGDKVTVSAVNELELKEKDAKAAAEYAKFKSRKMSILDFVYVGLSILLTAVSWGAYGPTLHRGQSAMQGSRLRPLICVGLAYLVIAVIIPFIFLNVLEPQGEFNFKGTMWSLGGGIAGAVGALGIILAFNSGGKPIFVMPLVFGCAPVINSFVEILGQGLTGDIGPLFYAGLLLAIVGAVTVLIFAPRPKPKPDAAAH